MVKQYTKSLLKEVFMTLASEKEINSITVNELANRCEINRNTFYYYYSDLTALIQDIIAEELEQVEGTFQVTLSWEESFLAVSQFLLQYKKAIYHIFKSKERQMAYNYIFQVTSEMMFRYVKQVADEYKIQASLEDQKIISSFYQGALLGLLMNWIDDKMQLDPQELVYKIGELFDGNVEQYLHKSETLNQMKRNY